MQFGKTLKLENKIRSGVNEKPMTLFVG